MQNKTLFTDFYQLTMMQGYVDNGRHDDEVVMDMFFRKNPCGGGYTIISGINELIDFVKNLRFCHEDIQYFKNLGVFSEKFLNILKDFSFTGEIYAVDDGSIMFPHEPIVRVKANILEALYIETAILSCVNFSSLIATKASRVCLSAKNDKVFEFGLRRSQGLEAGLLGSRASIVGGCYATSNVMAAKKFDLKISGTNSHAWVQSFENELEAFKAYAKTYPNECVLLVDTYDVLRSGVPNAIKVFKKLRENGHEPLGIRIDSGDLEYLSKNARKMLDDAGFENVIIIASNDLDEYSIARLKSANACINAWGVGTKLITSFDHPSLGGVYKMSAVIKNGRILPKIKISEDPRKINNPGLKQVYRLYDKATNKALADIITLEDELIDESKPLEIAHPLYAYKSTTIENFYAKKLLKPLFIDGKLMQKPSSCSEAAAFADAEKKTFWNEYLRNIKPAIYKVDLSQKLLKLREELIGENRI